MPDVMEELTRTEERKTRIEEAPKPKSKGKFIVLGILVVLAAVATWAYLHFRDRVSTDDAQVDAHITAIAPRIAGTVARSLVTRQQPVKAGDMLVRIDPRDYQVTRRAGQGGAGGGAEQVAHGADRGPA